MSAVRVTKSYVVIERAAATAISRRMHHLEQLVTEVRHETAAERELLDSALIELARATGAKDSHQFARRWLRAHRQIDEQGVTIVHRPPSP